MTQVKRGSASQRVSAKPRAFGQSGIRNWKNFRKAGNPIAEPPNLMPGKTVPGKELSLRQMLNRHNGIKTFDPVYFDDEAGIPENIERMDRHERHTMLKQVQSDMVVLQNRLVSQREAKRREADEAALRRKWEQERAATDNGSKPAEGKSEVAST